MSDHRVLLGAMVRLLDAPPVEYGQPLIHVTEWDGSGRVEHVVARLPDPRKTYISLGRDATADLLRSIPVPELEFDESMETYEVSPGCPACGKTDGRVDFFRYKGQTVVDLACHGFLLAREEAA
ncbi:hypothetical protein ACWDXD_24655 [Streptomyces sp. NPDC003314]